MKDIFTIKLVVQIALNILLSGGVVFLFFLFFRKREKIIVKDTAEYKKRESELERAKERAELLFRMTPSGIFTVDINGVVTSWNQKAAEITGYEYIAIRISTARIN